MRKSRPRGDRRPRGAMSSRGRASTADAGRTASPAARRAPIGVAMPTKSSERWIDDGDAIKAAARGGRLQGRPAVRRGRHPDPGDPGREHGHQGRQGPGHRLDRRHRPRRRAASRPRTAGIPVIAYDRLIREHRRRRLLHHVRQLQGRRAAGDVAASTGLEASGEAPRPVQRRAVRRLAGRQQRDLLLQRRDVGAAAVDRLRHDRSSSRVRPTSRRSPSCAGTPATAQKRMENLLTKTYSSDATSTACSSPYDGLSLGIIAAAEEQRLRRRRQDATRSSPARTPRSQSVKSIIAGEQYSTIFKDTRELAEVTVDMINADRSTARSRRSTTPRPTTTASRSSRRILLQPGGRRQGQHPAGPGRLRVLHRGRES